MGHNINVTGFGNHVSGGNINIGGVQQINGSMSIGDVSGSNIQIGGVVVNSEYEDTPKDFTIRLRSTRPEDEDVVYDICVEADGINVLHFGMAMRQAQKRVNTRNANGPIVWRIHSIKEAE